VRIIAVFDFNETKRGTGKFVVPSDFSSPAASAAVAVNAGIIRASNSKPARRPVKTTLETAGADDLRTAAS
jgi:hypothetical protein